MTITDTSVEAPPKSDTTAGQETNVVPPKTREELIAATVEKTGCTLPAARVHYQFWSDWLMDGSTDVADRVRTLGHYDMTVIHPIMEIIFPDDTESVPGSLHRDFEDHFTALLQCPDGRIVLEHTVIGDRCGTKCGWRTLDESP